MIPGIRTRAAACLAALLAGTALTPASLHAAPARATGAPVLTPAAARASAPTSTARTDVTGDGIPDLVTASTGRLLPGYDKKPDIGGGIYVIPGGGAGPTSYVTQDTTTDTGDVPGVSEADDDWGFSLATGDFDGDGRADVAVGAPFEDVADADGTQQKDAGAVTILYGTPTFPYLESRGLGSLVQGENGLGGVPEADDRLATSLAAGDFNNDGADDLAVGLPYENPDDATVNSGIVTVVYGSAGTGLTTTGYKSFDDSAVGAVEGYDHFGWSLATGDVTGDGYDDLALTVHNEKITGVDPDVARGAVVVFNGSASGLTTTGASTVDVADTGTQGKMNSIAVGRFRGGANADVIVNAGHAAGSPTGSGALIALAGGTDGISPSRITVISQDTTDPDVSGANNAATDDFFGLALAVGDLNSDGLEDLAAGTHGDTTGRGAVSVFYGDADGIFTNPDLYITENTPPINAGPADDEHFGHAVRILDTDGDRTPELTVNAPKEDGAYQTAASWTLKITGTGTNAIITRATRNDRDTLFASSCAADPTTSCFGPGFPIAGAVTGPIELPENGPYATKPGFTPYLEGLPADE